MKVSRRRLLHPATAAAAIPAVSRVAQAQAYPTRPVTMIVPFAAGGPTDVAARVVSEHMSRTLGQQLIVENVVGAGGTIGSLRAMRGRPDGYTIQIGHMGTHAISVSLYPNLAYKPDADFEPIGVVVAQPLLIAARKDFPAKDIMEFISYVKANAEKLNMAHTGVGSMSFSYALVLNAALGVKPALIPFGGNAPAMTALLGGQVDYFMATILDIGLLRAWDSQDLRNRGGGTQSGFAERAYHEGGRASEPRRIAMVGVVCAEGDASTRSRQAERCARQGA